MEEARFRVDTAEAELRQVTLYSTAALKDEFENCIKQMIEIKFHIIYMRYRVGLGMSDRDVLTECCPFRRLHQRLRLDTNPLAPCSHPKLLP